MVKMIITIIDIFTIFKIIEFINEKQYACAIIYFYALYVRKCNILVSYYVFVHRKTEGLYPVMAVIRVPSVILRRINQGPSASQWH